MKRCTLRLCLIAFWGLAGCRSSYSERIIGKYESVKYNYVAKNYLSFFKNTTYVLGSTLDINADSSYLLTNCGNIEDGKWQVHDDSLLLFCKNNRWRIDSFNKNGFNGKFPDCGNGEPSVFIIDKNILKKERKNKGWTVLYYFKKIK